MKRYASAIIMLVVLCGLAATGRARIAEPEDIDGLPTISPIEHQPIRASVIRKDPARYTLDIRKFANIGVNEDAQSFAIYLTNAMPTKCGDFRGLDLTMAKPTKYKRQLDLSAHAEVVKAFKAYGCIVLLNKDAPPAPAIVPQPPA